MLQCITCVFVLVVLICVDFVFLNFKIMYRKKDVDAYLLNTFKI